MRFPRRSSAALALVAGGALVLSACSAGRGTTSSSSSSASAGSSASGAASPQNITLTAAYEQEFGSYNNNTADQNAVRNVINLNQVLRGFWDYDEKGAVKADDTFGSYEQTSTSPQTVKYTINPKAVWSDGTKIDCKDLMLTWAANSGKFTSKETDADGNPTSGFSSAGTTGYDQMNQPECNAGDQTMTVTYAKPFADWKTMFQASYILPAHIVEQKSGVSDLLAAIKSKNSADLNKAAAWYNTGWIYKPGTIDKTTMLSDGPYMLDSAQAGQSVTLKANPKWWGTPAKVDTIVIRVIDATAQAQALANGEAQVVRPQPAQDILAQLKAVGDSVKIDQGQDYSFEHLDFNFKTDFADADLRKAFALCVPREQIVDKLIKPVNPDATVLNARYVLNFQGGYDQVVKAGYPGGYDAADVAQAKQILQSKGKTGLKVRIGYKTPNQRRTDEVSLIRDSCNQAGFDVQDTGTSDFFGNALANGNFDVALFAWSGSPAVSSNASAYTSTGGSNYGKYANQQVDTLTDQLLQTSDADQQLTIIGNIEKQLWADLATIPLWTFPGIQAYSTNVTGPVYQPAQTQQTWNMETWAPGKS